MNVTIVLAVVAAAVLLALLGWAFWGNPTERLRQQYFRSVHLSRAEAEAALERHLARVRQRFPGRTEAWYLHHILTDLKRDRR